MNHPEEKRQWVRMNGPYFRYGNILVDGHTLERKDKLMKWAALCGIIMGIACFFMLIEVRWPDWLKDLLGSFNVGFLLLMLALAGESGRGLNEAAVAEMERMIQHLAKEAGKEREEGSGGTQAR
jgi:hypothetical protein